MRAAPDAAFERRVLPSQAIAQAVGEGWISAGPYRIEGDAYQPASLDLRLGPTAWPLRCSFLPSADGTVEEKLEDLAFERIDIRDGATLERDRPYLIPLTEELALPPHIRGKANPKSSTGRLDVFTRVKTSRRPVELLGFALPRMRGGSASSSVSGIR